MSALHYSDQLNDLEDRTEIWEQRPDNLA